LHLVVSSLMFVCTVPASVILYTSHQSVNYSSPASCVICLLLYIYLFLFSLFCCDFLLFFFFFSSRRRHTRLVSDWSSDVCSSDLSCPRLLTSYPQWNESGK